MTLHHTFLSIAPPSLVNDEPSVGQNDETALVLNWMAPTNVDILLQYIVSFTVSSRLGSSRRRRQTMEITSPTNTATIMNPEPYADYTVNVDGEFRPPGATETVRAQVTPETTILSNQQRKYRLFVCL